MSGIQYFHDCESAAKESRDHEDLFIDNDGSPLAGSEEVEGDFGLREDYLEPEMTLTEEGFAELIAAQTSVQEENHARLALEIAKRARVFANNDTHWSMTGRIWPMRVALHTFPRKCHSLQLTRVS